MILTDDKALQRPPHSQPPSEAGALAWVPPAPRDLLRSGYDQNILLSRIASSAALPVFVSGASFGPRIHFAPLIWIAAISREPEPCPFVRPIFRWRVPLQPILDYDALVCVTLVRKWPVCMHRVRGR